MSSAYDVIVAGLGVMGSSVARELARRGQRVLGIDPLPTPHDRGSSHGRSRVIREAYFEHPLYVPMVQRAFGLWGELETECGVPLYQRTGAVMLGTGSGELVRGTLESVRAHELPHELLNAAAINARFPALFPAAGMMGILETRAGTLAAEEAHRALLASARNHGAVLKNGQELLSFEADGDALRVTTSAGTLACRRLVLACGAWTPPLARSAGFTPGFRVERQVVAFFDPPAGRARLDVEACPILLIEDPSGDLLYTLPDAGHGLKAALHHGGAAAEPETIDRFVSERDLARIRTLLGRYLPGADGRVGEAMVCMYTNSPDEHFVIDSLPAVPAAILASPCSGHGFKFAPVIGEIVADLVAGTPPAFDLGMFRANRFDAAHAG